MLCTRDFVKGEDVLTVEIEHVDAAAMQAVQDASGVDVEPTPHTLALIQDKFLQKEHFNKKCGVKVTSYIEISGEGSADLAGMVLGFPFMLKAKRYAPASCFSDAQHHHNPARRKFLSRVSSAALPVTE
jgi:phosphoribosylaminoimidazole carboxylase